MTENPPIEKVTAFVTRDRGATRELLVFQHPTGGIHLPAGTVEENEPTDVAALRETWEETGLTAVSIVSSLGAEPQTISRNYQMVLQKVLLRQHPEPGAPEVLQPFPSYLGLRRGLPVRQIGEIQNGYTPVAYEEFDGIADHPDAAPTRIVSGWIESATITSTLVRHFFHLQTTEPTRDSWAQSAEEWEHRFELYWVPLAIDRLTEAGLIPSQAAWLRKYAEKLICK